VALPCTMSAAVRYCIRYCQYTVLQYTVLHMVLPVYGYGTASTVSLINQTFTLVLNEYQDICLIHKHMIFL